VSEAPEEGGVWWINRVPQRRNKEVVLKIVVTGCTNKQ